MWDTLAPLAIQGGPSALLGLVIVSIVRGWLIPKVSHEREIAYRERTITALEETVAEQHKQIGILLGRLREPSS
jgi:hypothetical protein